MPATQARGGSSLHRRAFACQAASVSGSFAHGLPRSLPGKANHRLASYNIFTGCYKKHRGCVLSWRRASPKSVFLLKARSEKKKNRHEKTGPVCGIPFSIFRPLFYHAIKRFVCTIPACGAWEQSSAQKRNLFSERKSSMESDDSMELWCDRRDLNPYPYRTRPSNVRVCQFRHDRALRFCNDRYYIGFGGRLSR